MVRTSLVGLVFVPVLFASVPMGVPRDIAIERARYVSDVRYALNFTLNSHPTGTQGHEELRFKLSHVFPLLIDFREGIASNLIVNGEPVPVESENGHIRLNPLDLRPGENIVMLDFTAPVAPANKAITRYDDKDDGSSYIYTLFVPMDASMAFPCFDQPDLKARFTLSLTAPTSWTIVSNTRAVRTEAMGAISRTSFAETRPISTYFFAFAAGPFQAVHTAAGLPDVYVRKSQVARSEPEIPQIQTLTARGMEFLAGYFAQPFPFPKYDTVLIPGFPYGGMEHAGATFLNEDSMLFRTAPTDTDRFNRSITVLHELAHQWFGDFTTMRWFDDLWLKEGFAQYMAYLAMTSLAPDQPVWKRFYEQIKPAAYAIDETPGTTPIYQDIPNLLDAKSAYGAIVYDKAPGLLRELAFLIGDDAFRDGLRIYLREHAYGNAQWSDLVQAFERASGQHLETWATAWIRRRGLPEITTTWSCQGGRLAALSLEQKNVLGEGGTWPVATEILLGYADGETALLRVQFSGERAEVPEARSKTCPAYVFANNDDHAYGLFLLDSESRIYLQQQAGGVSDLFRRTLLWGALWDSVRFVQMQPRDYISVALDHLPSETDAALTRSLGVHATTALHRYVNAGTRDQLTPKFERLAFDRALHSPEPDLRIMWFRTLTAMAATPSGLGDLKQLLSGTVVIPGVELRPLDRWSIVAALIENNDPAAAEFYEAEKRRDSTGDGLKNAYVAAAAKPDATTKHWYFDDYLHNPSRQEDWIEQSLGTFNAWNQPELTRPYLRLALEALPQIKQQRKIFFLVRWLAAFIGGQQSAAADAEVHAWLHSAQIDKDLRLKVLQELDELDRTVRIRQAFP
ncbi:MAG: ERAP1-like C-terminal domain-containing protein [Acidobacteriaceae bacterium]|nr:ERAP1-like C-terminal domain-containing protein [Acidobacteriaceae bacterium]